MHLFHYIWIRPSLWYQVVFLIFWLNMLHMLRLSLNRCGRLNLHGGRSPPRSLSNHQSKTEQMNMWTDHFNVNNSSQCERCMSNCEMLLENSKQIILHVHGVSFGLEVNIVLPQCLCSVVWLCFRTCTWVCNMIIDHFIVVSWLWWLKFFLLLVSWSWCSCRHFYTNKCG